MKSIATGMLLAGMLFVSGPAQAGNGFGTGGWWMDGDDTPQVGQNVLTGACTGDATGLGLGLGLGDGTQPQPQDGTGFGSPFVQ